MSGADFVYPVDRSDWYVCRALTEAKQQLVHLLFA
jgi:hypothetical protein